MPYVETLRGLRGFSEEMRQVGRTPHGRTFEVVREAVRDKSLGLALITSVGDEVIRLSGVMYTYGSPRCRWSMSRACTPHQRSRSLE